MSRRPRRKPRPTSTATAKSVSQTSFLLADAFGGSDPRFDLDRSGIVDFGDFFLFAESMIR